MRAESEGLLARHTGRPVEEVRADTDWALVLAGSDAIDYGVVDAAATASGSAQLDARTALRPGA